MFEKVNPSHPDKIADRIAGALVDYAYTKEANPKIAVEVLIGHGDCLIIAETNVDVPYRIADDIVRRIVGAPICTRLSVNAQDEHLAKNQIKDIRCGDNGIFCGMPTTDEQNRLSIFVRALYKNNPTDGKFIVDGDELIACQSNSNDEDIIAMAEAAEFKKIKVNPLGYWTGGTYVDAGATNRKLGSDMGDAVTGGGLHGKDLSKADVALNIYAHIKAITIGSPVRLKCAIGDAVVDGIPYGNIVESARKYINSIGGFEKFAEWGLI